MKGRRIHVTGASGSGVTTLGRALADALALPHHDTDDYFWWRHEETESFLEWASHYEDGSREGRNMARHQAWLAKLPCPVLRLDGSRQLDALVVAARAAIEG
jgi:NAD(P)-dependent dehydrogenase (short-subunit alcohol dehydrogenase family)